MCNIDEMHFGIYVNTSNAKIFITDTELLYMKNFINWLYNEVPFENMTTVIKTLHLFLNRE